MAGELSLKDFAQQVYGGPGVAQQLLMLQDEHGLDVLLALCAAWMCGRSLFLTQGGWSRLVSEHRPVQALVIAPLRSARRNARPVARLSEEYQQLKALEVAVELSQLEFLHGVCMKLAQPGGLRLDNALLDCSRAQGLAPSPRLKKQLARLAVLLCPRDDGSESDDPEH
jgi:uncharacterized protein (TIGR02444 family)